MPKVSLDDFIVEGLPENETLLYSPQVLQDKYTPALIARQCGVAVGTVYGWIYDNILTPETHYRHERYVITEQEFKRFLRVYASMYRQGDLLKYVPRQVKRVTRNGRKK